jgi:hypothetical protein
MKAAIGLEMFGNPLMRLLSLGKIALTFLVCELEKSGNH